MKIYTKSGDKGKTSLVSGRRVEKNDELIEAYGTVDELNSFVGDLQNEIAKSQITDVLDRVQNKLFNIGSILAKDNADFKNYPVLTLEDVEYLENRIDLMDSELSKMTDFILPKGSPAIAKTHICRTVCRRAERRVVLVSESLDVTLIIKYLNRLSDYFFVLARYIHHSEDIPEIKWSKD